MGWSRVEAKAPEVGIARGDYFYFAHGFVCPNGPATVATATYGETAVPAVVGRGAWWGAQFQPQRTSAAGGGFLTAFLQS
jgi:glutamine amidotransferase